jgi:hypothetical protein
MAFERQSAHGKSIDELVDVRAGQWIFIYVILQSLPLVVVDAPGLRWTQGVEYFLCEVPKGSPPWSREDTANRQVYRVADGSVVNLPVDVVDHGVDGIFRRSHCWQAAMGWGGLDNLAPLANLHPPRASSLSGGASSQPSSSQIDLSGAFGGPLLSSEPQFIPDSQTFSPDGLTPRASNFGLDPQSAHRISVPSGGQTDGRKVSTPDPAKSFEDILGPVAPVTKKKRWDSLGGWEE